MASIPETFQTGLDHHRAGRLLEAEHFYRRVLQLHPRHAGAAHMLGLIAFQVGKHELATNLLNDAIRMDAFQAQYRIDLGEILQAQGKTDEAIASYQHAIRLNPELAEARNGLGVLLRAQGKLEQAIVCFQDATDLDPQYAKAFCNLGAALQKKGELAEAEAAYEQSVRLAPTDSMAYFRLGTALHEQGRLLEAMACYQKSLRMDPMLEIAAYQLTLARLALGEFAAGWPGLDLFARRQYGVRSSLPAWNGSDLQGKKVLVLARQGAEDVLQFIRYARLIADRGGEVFLDAEPAWIPLLSESGFDKFVTTTDEASGCDLQTHLLGLPNVFGTTLDSVPAAVPYLSAKPALISKWREELAHLSGLKVGIAWQGDPTHPFDRTRSIPLAHFEPLASVKGVSLVSLQEEHGLEQLAAIGNRFEMMNTRGKIDETNGARMDMAAILKNLDLVITSDSAVAHLAGVLGVPVWVALSVDCNWRWLRDRPDSPWYPTMRLFRQTAAGAWPAVIDRMAAELAGRVAEHRA